MASRRHKKARTATTAAATPSASMLTPSPVATTTTTTTTTTQDSSPAGVKGPSPSPDYKMGVTFCWAKWVDMNPQPTKLVDIVFGGRRDVTADGVEKLRNSFADCVFVHGRPLRGTDRFNKKLLTKGVQHHKYLLLYRIGGKIICKDGNHRLRAMLDWTYVSFVTLFLSLLVCSFVFCFFFFDLFAFPCCSLFPVNEPCLPIIAANSPLGTFVFIFVILLMEILVPLMLLSSWNNLKIT